jgi:arsenate reductase
LPKGLKTLADVNPEPNAANDGTKKNSRYVYRQLCQKSDGHAYLDFYGGPWVETFSAGTSPKPIHPMTLRVMREDGVPITHHSSNHVDEYKNISFDYVITVCDTAHEACPYYSFKNEKLHKNFPDPAKALGREEDINRNLSVFKK